MDMNERRKWLVLAATVAAQFMVIVDVSVVNVALPAIKHDLHFSCCWAAASPICSGAGGCS